jgi:hypothetical protein
VPETVDELHVELVAVDCELRAAAAVDDRGGAVRRSLLERLAGRIRLREWLGGKLLGGFVLEETMRREDHQSRVVEADEHRQDVRALRRPGLLVVGERGLVAVVAIRDQQLAVGKRLGDAVTRQAP